MLFDRSALSSRVVEEGDLTEEDDDDEDDIHSKRFEPRSISSSYCVIVWMRVVLKRTVVGD